MSEESRKGGDDPRPNPLTISDDSLQRIRQVLSYQFDLEILHKWREVHVLQEEIERGKRIQTVVEKLIMNGLIHSTRGIYFVEHVYGGDMPTSYPSSARSTPGGSIESSGYSPGRRGARSASYTVGKDRPQTEPQAQFEVRPDGTIVRYPCTILLYYAFVG